jgi:hypothetical protein
MEYCNPDYGIVVDVVVIMDAEVSAVEKVEGIVWL